MLLTATIDPKGMGYTKRSDPVVRMKDYELALSQWVQCASAGAVLFCENSGCDLDDLVSLARRKAHRHCSVTFLSFQGNEHRKALGKGYGEMGILRCAVEKLGLFARNQPILKVTGQYFVWNMDQVWAGIQSAGTADGFCNRKRDASADTRVAFMRPSFMTTYLFPLHSLINDSTGVYMEHAFARAIRTAVRDGARWEWFPVPPVIEGISGSLDLPIPAPRSGGAA